MTAMLLDAQNITITYGRLPQPVVHDLSIVVKPGQIVHLRGPSGAGKSSLLRVFAGLQTPQSGGVCLGGVDIATARPGERARLRREVVCYLAQDPPLIAEFDLVTNVALPAMIARGRRREARHDARLWLDRLGVGARTKHRRVEISGGELRRAAIARVLATGSPLLLLDEPFADLDADNIAIVAAAMADQVRQGAGVLLASHVPLPAELGQAEIYDIGAPLPVEPIWP